MFLKVLKVLKVLKSFKVLKVLKLFKVLKVKKSLKPSAFVLSKKISINVRLGDTVEHCTTLLG